MCNGLKIAPGSGQIRLNHIISCQIPRNSSHGISRGHISEYGMYHIYDAGVRTCQNSQSAKKVTSQAALLTSTPYGFQNCYFFFTKLIIPKTFMIRISTHTFNKVHEKCIISQKVQRKIPVRVLLGNFGQERKQKVRGAALMPLIFSPLIMNEGARVCLIKLGMVIFFSFFLSIPN